MSALNGFVTCRASPYVYKHLMLGGGCIYISGTEYNWKLKFSMQTHRTCTIFEYCHNNFALRRWKCI